MEGMIFRILFILTIINLIKAEWTICKTCDMVRNEEGYYFGEENGKECIIDPILCKNGVYKTGEFNTCVNCEIKYISKDDDISYGWENNMECKIDLEYCNQFIGSPKAKKAGSKYCSFCIIEKTDSDGVKWGLENEKECMIDTEFCNKNEDDEDHDYCMYCDSGNKVDKKGVKYGTENGKTCLISRNKCGNIKITNMCQYCSVTATGDDGSLWGWEDLNGCKIDVEKCKDKIEQRNNGKDEKSLASEKIAGYSIYIMIITILLIGNYLELI